MLGNSRWSQDRPIPVPQNDDVPVRGDGMHAAAANKRSAKGCQPGIDTGRANCLMHSEIHCTSLQIEDKEAFRPPYSENDDKPNKSNGLREHDDPVAGIVRDPKASVACVTGD